MYVPPALTYISITCLLHASHKVHSCFLLRISGKTVVMLFPPPPAQQHNFAVSLTTGPHPLPNRVPHRLRSSFSSFNIQYHLVSLRSSSSCLLLRPRLTFISIFPSITCSEGSSYARSDQASKPAFMLLHVGYFSPP